MVVFTCNHCGESLKKQVVSKHYHTKCKMNAPFMTCVDCLKDFAGTEYEAHTKCVTEEQRYSAKGFVPKPSSNKGVQKQSEWYQHIQNCRSSTKLSSDEKSLLETLCRFDNIPRNKTKYLNFIKNGLSSHGPPNSGLAVKVFTFLEESFKDLKNNENSKEDATNGNGKQDENKGQEDDRKRKRVNENSDENSCQDKEKKKKKKNKKQKLESDLTPVSENVNDELIDVDEGAVVSKKDKKKNKSSENCENNNVVRVENKENLSTMGNAEKKRKKNKKQKSDVLETTQELDKSDAEVIKKNSEELDNSEKFIWDTAIVDILKKKTSGMNLKKLEKKVLKRYCKANTCEVSEKIKKKFIKKLKKVPNVSIKDDVVTFNI